jgi:glycosyltransferase involved in cell wall biosynthesis
LSVLKGVDTLLEAFSDPRLRHVDLVVLGTGDPALTRRPLPPNIRLLGHRPPAEVRQWMAQACCLVHPTRADTSPNCVKEARVIGLPVVTTPNGGQTQYVAHLKSGFIHPAGDVAGLIQGVLAVSESQETSLKMGSTGQAECRAKLTPAATAKRLLEIYRR